jgi:hypothetical protein
MVGVGCHWARPYCLFGGPCWCLLVELMSGMFEAELTTSLHMSFHKRARKNLSQWGRWGSISARVAIIMDATK